MQKDYTKIDEEFDKKFVTYFGDIPVIDCDTVRIKDIKNFLHTQISLSEQSLLERVEKEIQDYFTRMININDGKLPYVIFGGKADENEKITLYKSGLDDALKILTSLKHLPQEEVKNK